ncbi:hypothetical protein Patl1_14373 [Pistacia atlantica]|uniref:Uncharacterized protein n=1 Tax=Pistacia atlantica TaxID=434234 RepID=A0ACC1AS68_9ROSI|nr:hypothetical protein Patl1_14373 [Pistacia atlantica]
MALTEIDNQVGNDHLIDESDLAKLPYLRYIINETMGIVDQRLLCVVMNCSDLCWSIWRGAVEMIVLKWCSVLIGQIEGMYLGLGGPLLLAHESSKECMVGGFRIPRGTMLVVNMWATQNDPKIWEDPKKFKPERFEGIEGSREGFKFMPFGGGRRGCPCEGLAMQMIGLTLGTIFQCFQWERINEKLADMTEGDRLILQKAQPLQAKCRPRPMMFNFLSQI